MKEEDQHLYKLWNNIKETGRDVHEFLDTPFAKLGETDISVFFILYVIICILLVLYLSKKAKQILVTRILNHTKLDIGVTQSIGTIVRYFLVILGLIIIFQSAGLDLTALSFLAGAVGVGIGLGLQNIFNNFVSGLIILFERPIKIGDRVQVEDISGDVVRIAARATTIITNDNISIIIPNSEFVSSRVINWSHNDRMIRFRIPIRVSFKEDPEFIRKLLLEVAADNVDILLSPAPEVIFVDYATSALQFELWVWTIKQINRPLVLKSQLYFAISKKFKEHQIVVPFPQHDLHIKSGLPPIS